MSLSPFRTQERLGVAAILLAASTLLSRLMGLIRDKIISWQFGAGSEADLYFAAFVVPDCINYLLAGGFMSITIIPLLGKAFANDTKDAWAFFSCVVTWMALASTILTLGCMLCANPLADLLAPGFSPSQRLRLATFMRIILPAQIFFLTGSCATALLFLRRQFRVPALSPLIYNAAIIAAGLLLPFILSLLNNTSYHEESNRVGMLGYCIGVSIGAFLGAFALPLAVARQGEFHLRPCLTHPLMRRFCIIALPLMLGQTIIMLDEQLLRVFGSLLQEGTVSLLNYARRISQVPIGLVGQAAAVASYPFLVQLINDGKTAQLQETLCKAMKTCLLLSIPIACCMIACSGSIITLLFHGGRFGVQETMATIPLMDCMLCVVPFWVVYMVLVRAFYAYQNTICPAVTGTIVTLLALPVYFWVTRTHSPLALAITSAISILCYVLWLFVLWNKRYPRLIGLIPFAGKILACALPATLCTALLHNALYDAYPASPLASIGILALSGTLYLLIMGGLALCVPSLKPSVHEMLSRIPLRRKRS
ncbi:MAG: murein biosynthesis integral membrane protein MurJ [Desulfovibrio sp.]|nr:murein biosynthesis integral membrane protein MurJ [Desulfovibrio sp.]